MGGNGASDAHTRIRIGSTVFARHPWAVAALPGDPDAPGAGSALITGGTRPRNEVDQIAGALDPSEAVAITASRRPPPPVGPAPAAIRALRLARSALASASLRLRATVIERHLRRAGFETRRIDIGAGEDGYDFSLGGGGIRLPADCAVVATRSGAARPATLLERAVADAERALGTELEIERGRVLASGTVMVDLRGSGRGFLLRLAAPEREPAVAAADGPVDQLLAAGPPAAVRERIVRPIVRGAVDALRWAVEERRAGTHPRHLSDGLWGECREFLMALAATPRPHSAEQPPTLVSQAAELEHLLDADERRVLRRVAAGADEQLAGLPRHWGHGDFHPGNLLVDEGLTTVLDWDAASPQALPGLDLLHLVATTDSSLRRLPHGARAQAPLKARVAPTGDERLARALSDAGVPSEPVVREALVDAYWLGRVVRDVLTFPDWAEQAAWFGPNLRRPLADIALGALQ